MCQSKNKVYNSKKKKKRQNVDNHKGTKRKRGYCSKVHTEERNYTANKVYFFLGA